MTYFQSFSLLSMTPFPVSHKGKKLHAVPLPLCGNPEISGGKEGNLQIVFRFNYDSGHSLKMQ
jgi:hypothetical protein